MLSRSEGFHLAQLILAGRGAGHAGRGAQRIVPHEPDVIARASFPRDEVEIFAEGPPGNRCGVAEVRQLAGDHVSGSVGNRRAGIAAIPHHLGGNALTDSAVRPFVGVNGPVAMAVRVHKARADDLACGVNHTAGLRPGQRPDVYDLIAFNGDIGRIGRIARAVSDPTVADQNV